MEHGHSVEEKRRQILNSTLGNSSDIPNQDDNARDRSKTENWLNELEELGILDRAKNRSKDFTSGERDTEMLKEFFSERHR